MTHHGVYLMKEFTSSYYLLHIDPEAVRKLLLLGFVLGDKFMERRIKQADRDGKPLHDLEGRLDITLYIGEELIQGRLPFFHSIAEDHLPEQEKRFFTILAVKHVFCPEETYPLGAEIPSHPGIFLGVGIGPDTELAIFINRSEEHTSELQSRLHLVCRLL